MWDYISQQQFFENVDLVMDGCIVSIKLHFSLSLSHTLFTSHIYTRNAPLYFYYLTPYKIPLYKPSPIILNANYQQNTKGVSSGTYTSSIQSFTIILWAEEEPSPSANLPFHRLEVCCVCSIKYKVSRKPTVARLAMNRRGEDCSYHAVLFSTALTTSDTVALQKKHLCQFRRCLEMQP